MIQFVELTPFTKRREVLLDDESFRALQNLLSQQPERGDVMPRCGGFRKLRFGHQGRGKRGGLRVIYLHVPSVGRIYLALVYNKTKQDNITPDKERALASAARAIRLEL